MDGTIFPVTKEHPVRGHEAVAEILIGEVGLALADSALQFVLVPMFDTETGQIVGFHMTPYPADFEMKGDF